MSELFVLTREELKHGFQLAGVQTSAASSAEEVRRWLEGKLEEPEAMLLAVDDRLHDLIGDDLHRHVEHSHNKFVIAIPGGEPMKSEAERRERFAELMRQAIGFQVRFGAEEEGGQA